MRNIRYIARLVTTFFLRFKALIILGIIVGFILFLLLNWIVPLVSSNSVQRVGMTGKFTSSTLPYEIVTKISRGLTVVTENGEVVEGLASSWETPDNGKTWIFHLNNQILWQDGEKIDSYSINYQFTDSEIERPDENTIVFKLQSAYSPFPSIVATPSFKKGLLGVGEWKVKKISFTGEYIDKLLIENNLSQKILYKFYPSEERLKLAFKLGQVDSIENLMNIKPFDKWEGLKIEKIVDYEEFVGIFLNTQDKNLSEKSFRQALSYAIDKKSLGYERALSPISLLSWAYNPQVKPYDYDFEKAKESIKSNVEINLSTPPVLLPIAEKIAKNWEAVGVKTNIQVYSVIPSDYQALLAIFDIPSDPDQYSIWHSTQTATNITKYASPRIDKLLEDGRLETNLEERKKIYLDFQRFLVEDSPAIFLYYPETYNIFRP